MKGALVVLALLGAACETIGSLDERRLVDAAAGPRDGGPRDAAPGRDAAPPRSDAAPDRDASDVDRRDAAAAPDGPALCPAAAGNCPADMVAIPGSAACIDRFEASRGEGQAAVSARAAVPWTDLPLADARAACQRAGKRLCTDSEWIAACRGTCGRAYPYGEAYVGGACVDRDEGRGAGSTGALASCEGGLPGLHDMSGNVAEWLEAGTAAGGSFASGADGLRCEGRRAAPDAGAAADVGFRCCR